MLHISPLPVIRPDVSVPPPFLPLFTLFAQDMSLAQEDKTGTSASKAELGASPCNSLGKDRSFWKPRVSVGCLLLAGGWGRGG